MQPFYNPSGADGENGFEIKRPWLTAALRDTRAHTWRTRGAVPFGGGKAHRCPLQKAPDGAPVGSSLRGRAVPQGLWAETGLDESEEKQLALHCCCIYPGPPCSVAVVVTVRGGPRFVWGP